MAFLKGNTINLRYVVSLCVWCVILLYPQFVYAYIHNRGISYICTGLVFLSPVFVIAMVLPRKWMYCAFVVVCSICSIIELTMVDLYSGYLLPGAIISTLWTNQQEASEFYRTNIHEVYRWLPILLLCFAACLCYKNVKLNKWIYVAVILLLLSPVAFVKYKLNYFYRETPITLRYYLAKRVLNRPPYNVVYASVGAWRTLDKRKKIDTASSICFNAHRDMIPSQKEIYVLAIGESLRYANVSLNGIYTRSTTPRLETYNNLILFDNYYSQACLTMYSVPMLITRATPLDYELNYAERSIVEPFRECGFKTYVLVNSNLLAEENYLSYGCDSLIVVPNMVENNEIISGDKTIVHIIDSLASQHDKLFVLCQFLGNHGFYTNYDTSCDVYHPNSNDDGALISLVSLANAYDNSILYTDYILDTLIRTIDRPLTLSAMMFVSDHGEDISFNGCGHGGNCDPPELEYHVPLIFWWSDMYSNRNPETIENAVMHKTSKLNGDCIFYSACAMAGIKIDSIYDEPNWNILSPQFCEHERLILVSDGVTTINPDKR